MHHAAHLPRHAHRIAATLLAATAAVTLSSCSGSDSPGGPGTGGAVTSGAGAGAASPKAVASTVPLPAPSPTQRVVSVAPRSGAADPRADKATEVVSRFYSAYLTRPGKATATNFVEPALLKKLFAPPPDFDRVLCAHALPDTAGVSPATLHGATATVRVTTAKQGAKRPPIEVIVRASDLRITKIVCPV